MWKIEVNNIALEFDGSIATQLINPMFSDEISHSLQFTIKNTIANRKALGFLNMPEITDNKSRELPCTIKADPLVFTGTVVVAYQNGDFSCYFKQNGDFWSAIKDKYLKDIPFDITTFDPVKDYAGIKTFIEQYQESFDYDYTFPVCVNLTVPEKFDINVTAYPYINVTVDPAITIYPIIPFLYVRSVYEAIFKKNGITIGKNAFFNSFLRKLVMPNNYMINELELDTSDMEERIVAIRKITNDAEPTVTTHAAHSLESNNFVKLFIEGTEIPLNINDRIFQIEVVDSTNFKLLNEDFSEYDEYNRLKFGPSEAHKVEYYGFKWLQITVPNPEDIIEEGAYYFQSDDWNQCTICSLIGCIGPGNVRIIITWDDLHTYANAIITKISGDDDPFLDGTLFVLPPVLKSTFKEINPTNHVPDITIKDFLDQCKYLVGIIPFIRSGGCDIKTFKEIILSPEIEEISETSQIIRDIENPNLDGYLMKMLTDASDTWYKAKLPVQSIDAKYTVKDAVATRDDLDYEGSETNDVRLVTDENCYYVFNKSFLNKDNNWNFLCYNLLDLQESDGNLIFDTKFSTLLPFNLSQVVLMYLQFDVNCRCRAFENEVRMIPRVIIYYGVFTVESQRTVVALNKAWVESGDIPPDVFSLRWDGEHGLYEKVHKQYIDWQLNVRKDCVTLVQWPMKLLADFDFSKKYRIRAIDYLVKSIKFTLNFKTSQVEFNETELAKV